MSVRNVLHHTESQESWTYHGSSWLGVMVGNSKSVQNARSVDLTTLSAMAKHNKASNCEQIQVDLIRSASPTSVYHEHSEALTIILESWVTLNEGIGYSQGMDMMSIMLYVHFLEENSPKPMHDTLAALGFVCRVNAGFIPLHPHDKAPLNNAALFATEVWLEVSSSNPLLGSTLLSSLGHVEIFGLKYLAVCFANLFSSATLRIIWNYLFDSEGMSRDSALALAARRCRHYVSATLIQHKKLFTYGKDISQNFSIFEHSVAQLTDERTALSTIHLAKHLERIETMGGSAR